jgi:hypothetical protein
MTQKLISVEDSDVQHFGSVYGVTSVSANLGTSTPDFVTIENKKIMTDNNKMNVPTHQYDVDGLGNPLFHSHSNQTVDSIQQSFVTIEDNDILIVDDKSTSEDIRIMDGGTNDFVSITI